MNERALQLRRRATSRMVAALCLSAFVHASMPLFLNGGASHRQQIAPESRALSARIVQETQPTFAEAPAEARPVIAPESPRDAAMLEERPRAREKLATAAPSAARPQPRVEGSIPEAPDLTYYPAKQLDVYPRLSTQLDLQYRGKAAAEGVAGRALLLVMIDEVGSVNDVSVVEAEPASYFEDDARRAFLGARFTPAYRNGRAVRSRVLIEVNYGAERGSP